jgi:hypothetical protein
VASLGAESFNVFSGCEAVMIKEHEEALSKFGFDQVVKKYLIEGGELVFRCCLRFWIVFMVS